MARAHMGLYVPMIVGKAVQMESGYSDACAHMTQLVLSIRLV